MSPATERKIARGRLVHALGASYVRCAVPSCTIEFRSASEPEIVSVQLTLAGWANMPPKVLSDAERERADQGLLPKQFCSGWRCPRHSGVGLHNVADGMLGTTLGADLHVRDTRAPRDMRRTKAAIRRRELAIAREHGLTPGRPIKENNGDGE